MCFALGRFVYLCRASEGVAARARARGIVPVPVESSLVVGDVLVFEGDVPHYGSDYLIRNTRVHLYLDLIGVEMRVENESYLYR